MRKDDHSWPAPRLTAYGLWLVGTRLGAPILAAAVVLDLLWR